MKQRSDFVPLSFSVEGEWLPAPALICRRLTLAVISAIRTASAIQVAAAFFSRSSFPYSFKRNAHAILAHAHNPAPDFHIFISFSVWQNQLNFLAEKEFIFRFNKNAAAADIDHQAFMVFVMAFKKNRLNIGPAGILAGISPCLKSAIS